MPSVPLGGEPVPPDGALPADAYTDLERDDFGVYVHVPFCATRCGYCDFNTYTAEELRTGRGPDAVTATRESYADTARGEIALARRALGDAAPPVSTVFFGGGTPTLLPPEDLGRILVGIDSAFGLAPDAEVTTEANPESVDADSLKRLRDHGFTRVSFGMQSAKSRVLATLDRHHTPGRALDSVRWATEAGFEHVSLDLIYGTPGETDADWEESVRAAVDAGPDHISAYSLIVEPGTRMATQVRRGVLPAPDEDAQAERYLAADAILTEAGYTWYEVSNWASRPQARCRHNALYWTNGNWWGVGPGAHSHVGGTRWWNVKHPATYAGRLAEGVSPAEAREVLTEAERRFEHVMLRLRLAEGCPTELLTDEGLRSARTAVADGLLEADALVAGRAVLTRRGRLFGDAVVRSLT
ncbi:coproporphyrinogen III oxidase [Spiractinospora alimapuensis]|uniref:radical SAM family heme chaperone HemW n=1 Tax=Spiractinospora alimapuensis TaxID=2820884 RepID=UPI001EEA4F03|nr:radical SAM family heme chaperone HemW [Spiractinospora alimapuensis]QVQ53611.1 coproporphyrinogen III oxidase [Spiractinospora alimapuensis]